MNFEFALSRWREGKKLSFAKKKSAVQSELNCFCDGKQGERGWVEGPRTPQVSHLSLFPTFLRHALNGELISKQRGLVIAAAGRGGRGLHVGGVPHPLRISARAF